MGKPRSQKDAVSKIKIGDLVVTVARRTQTTYILTDENAGKLIETVLLRAVSERFLSDSKAISHSKKDPVVSPGSHGKNDISWRSRSEVRSKVHWQSREVAWVLQFVGEKEKVSSFCREHSISLCVSPDLTGDDFANARQKAFEDAWSVLNAVDTSKRRRIQHSIQHIKVRKSTGSESSESEISPP